MQQRIRIWLIFEVFSTTIKAHDKAGEGWLEAPEKGEPFRNFAALLEYEVQVWATPTMERCVDERLAFAAKKNPGSGCQSRVLKKRFRTSIG